MSEPLEQHLSFNTCCANESFVSVVRNVQNVRYSDS